jgi:hypothetical protein
MLIIEFICSAFILFAIYLACSCLWHERKARVPPVPVLPHVKRRALKLALKHTDASAPYKIIDLGCGWGGVMLSLARVYKKATITGYEISPWPYRFAKLRTALKGKRVRVRRQNIFDADISDQDIIYCYLHPETLKELRPVFETLKPGALIISCSFPIPEWTAIAREDVAGVVNIPIFIYKINEKK